MASILIVEDDITFGTMINSWLRRKGFVSEKVSSVSAAKSKLQDSGNTYDLILSDLRLPDHDGLVLLEWMRQCDMDIPFIVMTSYAEVQNAVLAMKSGAADYIAKPLQPDVLLQKNQRCPVKASGSGRAHSGDRTTVGFHSDCAATHRRKRPRLKATLRIHLARCAHTDVCPHTRCERYGKGICRQTHTRAEP